MVRWCVGLGIVAALVIGTGCGRCKGGIRSMKTSQGENDDTPVLLFSVWGDGPGGVTSDELLGMSGVNEENFLVTGPDGAVDAAITGSWGGHSCMNGVYFDATVSDPVPGASYEAVMWIEQLAWPFIGDEDILETRDGEQVLVGRLTADPVSDSGT